MATAVLRSASGALRPARLLPRRCYSCDANKVKNVEAAVGRVSMKLDELGRVLETRQMLMERLVDEKIKYDRLKRFLVRGSILVGVGVCVKKLFFGAGSEEAKKTTGSD